MPFGAPDFADFLKDAAGLLAVMSVECVANGVEPNPVAGTFIAEAGAPSAGALALAVGRAADGVGASASDLENAGATLDGGFEGDDFVADDEGAGSAKLLHGTVEPLFDTGQGGAGHAGARPRQRGVTPALAKASVSMERRLADPRPPGHAQALDGTAFNVSEHAVILHDGCAGAGATAVNSQN